MILRDAAPSIRFIETRIAPLRARLAAHPLYENLKTTRDLKHFMQFHVFAVWDFMSLLKALQAKLTCVEVPWKPTRWPDSRRFINEIVLGEESDTFEERSISHFELYLEALEECDADSGPIQRLLAEVKNAEPSTKISELLENAAVPDAARRFVESTFQVIGQGHVNEMAAAFTFGREDLIPDIFRALVHDLKESGLGRLDKFCWYLERHIEVDGEDHGPLSLRMLSDLCGNDRQLWERAAAAAEKSIAARLALWDGVLNSMSGMPVR